MAFAPVMINEKSSTKRGRAGQNDTQTPAGRSAKSIHGSVLEQAGVDFKSIAKRAETGYRERTWGTEKYPKSTQESGLEPNTGVRPFVIIKMLWPSGVGNSTTSGGTGGVETEWY